MKSLKIHRFERGIVSTNSAKWSISYTSTIVVRWRVNLGCFPINHVSDHQDRGHRTILLNSLFLCFSEGGTSENSNCLELFSLLEVGRVLSSLLFVTNGWGASKILRPMFLFLNLELSAIRNFLQPSHDLSQLLQSGPLPVI